MNAFWQGFWKQAEIAAHHGNRHALVPETQSDVIHTIQGWGPKARKNKGASHLSGDAQIDNDEDPREISDATTREHRTDAPKHPAMGW